MIETYDNFRFIECDNDNKTTTTFLFQIYHYLLVTYIKIIINHQMQLILQWGNS